MSLKSFLYNYSPQCLKDYRKKLLTSPYPIVKNPNEVFNKVYKVKEETWEDSYYPECYGLCKEQHLVIKDKKGTYILQITLSQWRRLMLSLLAMGYIGISLMMRNFVHGHPLQMLIYIGLIIKVLV